MLDPDRVRRPGGGRKLLVKKDATLLDALLALVEPSERGDPMSLAANAGWVSVGVNHDTAAFAVQTIRRWWAEVGSAR